MALVDFVNSPCLVVSVGPGEVAELEEMGFPDTRRNIEALALAATEGNIPDAVDRLLGGQ